MNIVFLTTRLEKPSARFRLLQYLPFIEEKGWNYEVQLIPKGSFERRSFFSALSEFDVVFLQKRLFGFLDFRALRKNSKKLIYDFDDAVMYKDSGAQAETGTQSDPSRQKRFERTVGSADLVIAGNTNLRELASRFSKNIEVIPTPVDTSRYGKKTYKTENPTEIVLGWMGSRSTLFYLEGIRKILDKVHKLCPETILRVIADVEYEASAGGMPVENKKWSFDDEPSDLRGFDIGLMPLTADPWSRGKCGFKLLQYMASGVASIASPVGVNQDILKSSSNGILASGTSAWVDSLVRLIKDPVLRAELGASGRRSLEEKYSLSATAPKLLNVIEDLV
ncbi:MAG: glycosyltransferase family 4 protein [Deltaproteobacteria bacterium]|nr:glycosyltransferase family 4 protein [Deltaproteobacteria bacterium]